MDLLAHLQSAVLLADGAMGTELLAAGVQRGRCLEELCQSEPERIRGIHATYLKAGARLLKTNTFGANAVRLAAPGLERQVAGINRAAVRLALETARPGGAWVAGSVGPLGFAEAVNREAVFREQIEVLIEAGVDAIFLESFTSLSEIAAALQAMPSGDCPVIASLACRDDGRLFDGTSLAAAFAFLREAGADAVGINCTAASPALLAALSAADPRLPLAVFPSAGFPAERPDGKLIPPVTPGQFAEGIAALAGCGARLLGGCCGAGPAHLAAAREALTAARFISPS